MPAVQIAWPDQTRHIREGLVDSTRWKDVSFRDDDILVDTFAKSGTNWVKQIVAQLIHNGAEDRLGMTMGPYLEMTWIPPDVMLAQTKAETDRRLFGSHLPLDALPFSPKVKYICVGRDARDVVWSAHNHRASFTAPMLELFKDAPGWDPDIRAYYRHWLEHDDGMGIWAGSLWRYARACWSARELPNVLLVHFNNLKAELASEIRRIASYLGIAIDEARWPAILTHCSFDYMREATSKVELLQRNFREGSKSFFHRGTNGRWKDVLAPDEIAECDAVAAKYLTADCAHWLKTGAFPKPETSVESR
jgi:aryl sulfotransferase